MGISKLPLFQQRTDEFTTSGTWVCPADVLSAEFLVVGAGGGGGGAYCNLVTYAVGGGGGGGGAVKKVIIPTTPGSTYTITIGAKGTGGTSTAGANGGFSEVLLSGTTLIRSLGGQGGQGINNTPAQVTASEVGSAGGGGASTTATATDSSASSGGGGGAFYSVVVPLNSQFTSVGTAEGSQGKIATTVSNASLTMRGSLGIDGFGSGGNGANWNNSTAITTYEAPYGAGAGATISNTTGAANGANATIKGCGGGAGACILTAATGSNGGDGADGLVRITYFA